MFGAGTDPILLILQTVYRGTQEAERAKKDLDGLTNSGNSASKMAQQLEINFGKTAQSLSFMQKAVVSVDSAIEAAIAGLQKYAIVVVAVVAAALALTGVGFALARGFAQQIEQLDIMSKRASMSRQEYAGLALTMENIGSSAEAAIPAIRNLSVQMKLADKDGTNAQAAFKRLGVETRDQITGAWRPAGQVFKDTIEALGGVENVTERNNLAAATLGRNYSALVPIFGQNLDLATKTADAFQGITDAEFEAGKKADEALDRIGNAMAGIKTQVSATLTVAVLPFLEALAQGATRAAVLSNVVTNLLSVAIEKVYEKVKPLVPILAALFGIPKIDIVTPLDKQKAKGALGGEQEEPEAKKLTAIKDTIAMLEKRVEWEVISRNAELETLQAMLKQVDTQEELLVLRKAIAEVEKKSLEEWKRGFPQRMADEAKMLEEMVSNAVLQPRLGKLVPERMSFANKPPEEGSLGAPPGSLTFMGSLMDEIVGWTQIVKQATNATGQFNEEQAAYLMGINETTAALTDANNQAYEFARTLTLTLHESIKESVIAMAGDLSQIQNVFKTVFKSLQRAFIEEFADKVADAIVKLGKKILEKMGGGGPLGDILGFASFALMSSGGKPIRAQNGVVMSGSRGFDSAHALLEQGEMVVSRKDTDRLTRLLDSVDSPHQSDFETKNEQRGRRSGSVFVSPGAVVIQGGVYDEKRLSELVTEKLASKIFAAQKSGGIR